MEKSPSECPPCHSERSEGIYNHRQSPVLGGKIICCLKPFAVFDCLVAREHKVEDAPIHHKDTWSVTWYAPGIGYVRHDSYDKKMRLLSSEVLFTRTAK
ncbi:MAG: hypothetical protein J6Y27_05060 [Bacteroidales bacterium]|nr:hypothetical protein [Bacteroidales bacterium]